MQKLAVRLFGGKNIPATMSQIRSIYKGLKGMGVIKPWAKRIRRVQNRVPQAGGGMDESFNISVPRQPKGFKVDDAAILRGDNTVPNHPLVTAMHEAGHGLFAKRLGMQYASPMLRLGAGRRITPDLHPIREIDRLLSERGANLAISQELNRSGLSAMEFLKRRMRGYASHFRSARGNVDRFAARNPNMAGEDRDLVDLFNNSFGRVDVHNPLPKTDLVANPKVRSVVDQYSAAKMSAYPDGLLEKLGQGMSPEVKSIQPDNVEGHVTPLTEWTSAVGDKAARRIIADSPTYRAQHPDLFNDATFAPLKPNTQIPWTVGENPAGTVGVHVGAGTHMPAYSHRPDTGRITGFKGPVTGTRPYISYKTETPTAGTRIHEFGHEYTPGSNTDQYNAWLDQARRASTDSDMATLKADAPARQRPGPEYIRAKFPNVMKAVDAMYQHPGDPNYDKTGELWPGVGRSIPASPPTVKPASARCRGMRKLSQMGGPPEESAAATQGVDFQIIAGKTAKGAKKPATFHVPKTEMPQDYSEHADTGNSAGAATSRAGLGGPPLNWLM